MRRTLSCFALSLLALSSVAGRGHCEGDCNSPRILHDDTTEQWSMDLAKSPSHYSSLCGLLAPGPDEAFLADGYNTNLVFRVTNIGVEARWVYLILSYDCADTGSCAMPIYAVPLQPGFSVTLNGTVPHPLFVFVVGSVSAPSIPVRIAYSMGSAVSVEPTTWSTLKSLYAADRQVSFDLR
jgi:hypothetical protein